MDSPDKADAKAAFRKPSNDASSRKYRRHSSTTPSPPPDGNSDHRRYRSRNVSEEDSITITDDAHRRKSNSRDLYQISSRYARGGDSYTHDRRSSKGYHSYRKHDDYRDDIEKDYSKFPPRTSRDSRVDRDRDFDRIKNDNDYKRSGDVVKYPRTRDSYDGTNHKSKHTERESPYLSVKKDEYTREKPARNETRVSRSYDEADSSHTSSSKKPKLLSTEKSADMKNSEHSHGALSTPTTQPSSVNGVDDTNNLDAAKVAALRAAELVNKNLVGVGVVGALSTDQKKKLLWGSKKKAVEESGHCWDASLFPDREQQEKFNRLMGVKGEVKAESKGIIDPEKQKELQLDLEKQYTAGLRRRDGRTVGLGL